MRQLWCSACVALMLLPVGAASAQEGGTTEMMERALAAGWKASFTCSGLFVAGQTLAEIDQNELSGIYPDFERAFDQLPAAVIDKAAKTVSVSYADGQPPRIAAYRPGFGCSQLAIGAGKDGLAFLPRFGGWPVPPAQDRGSAIGSNVKLQLRTEEAERLELPVSSAFDEMTYGPGTRTASVVIVRDGQVMAERYARGIEQETPIRTWSVGKSITATIIGAAVQRGRVSLDHQAVVRSWNSGADPRRAITLRHLLQMTSGLDSGENGARTDRLYFAGARVIDEAVAASLEVQPGTRFKYSNDDTVIAMRALREAMGSDDAFHRFPYEQLLHKIGAVRTTLETDWNGDFISSSQIWATGRDLARIGQLYLQDGMWGSERLLPEGWRDFVRTPGPAQPAEGDRYGAQFWLMPANDVIPPGTFYASGNRGQFTVVVPEMNTVIVRQGFDMIGGGRFDIARFTADILRALKAAEEDRDAAIAAASSAENTNAAATGSPRTRSQATRSTD